MLFKQLIPQYKSLRREWIWRGNLHANAGQYLKTTQQFLSEDLCKKGYLLFSFTDTVFC